MVAPRARRAAQLRRRHGRALHQRRDHDCGAEPLLLLDYVAANRIELEQVAELVEGAAEVCRAAGVRARRRRDGRDAGRLPRGASSTSPATCVGVVERARLIDGSGIEAGDVVVGFPSAGVHANGFTLVRRVLEEEDYDGADLLAPTRLYLDVVRRLRGRAHAFAHVTGGGIAGNLDARPPRRAARRDRLGRVGAAAGVRLARAPRRRGRAAARLQPRHRLLRRRRATPSRASS